MSLLAMQQDFHCCKALSEILPRDLQEARVVAAQDRSDSPGRRDHQGAGRAMIYLLPFSRSMAAMVNSSGSGCLSPSRTELDRAASKEVRAFSRTLVLSIVISISFSAILLTFRRNRFTAREMIWPRRCRKPELCFDILSSRGVEI